MKHLLSFLLLILLPLGLMATTSKEKTAPTVYAFAYGTTLSDSTAYISAVAQIPNATLAKSTKFLEGRGDYARQFKSYLERTYPGSAAGYTCAIFFDTKRATLEKKFLQLRKKAGSKKHPLKIVEVAGSDFKFSPIQ